MSPILFNIFINDLMDGLEETSGVLVPVGPIRSWQQRDIRVAGALFADDAAGISPTIEAAANFCARITEWSTLNEMSVGISKCGIMEFLAQPDDEPTLTEDHPLRPTLQLSGQLLPIVTKYKYLGLGLTPQLEIRDLVQSRFDLGRKSVYALLPFLRSSVLPPSMRWQVVRAVILPRLLYGAEVYGMNRTLTNRMQTLLNQALRGILGGTLVQGAGRLPSAPLWAEFGTAPVCALAASRRARAYRKCFDLKTAIGTIIHQPLGIANWTWTSGTARWITRYCAKYFDAVSAGTGRVDWTQLAAGPLRDLIRDSITLRERNIREKPTRTTSSTTALYFQSGYMTHPLTKGRVYCRPSDNKGITIVLVCRIGAYPTALQLVERKRLPNRYKRQCPFCRTEGVPETLHHLLFDCHAWRRQRRESGLEGTIAEVRRLEQRVAQATTAERNLLDSSGTLALSREELALSWILGGVHARTWGVPSYMPQPPKPVQAEDDQSYSSSSLSSDNDSMGIAAGENRCRVKESPHLLKVGRFLVKIESVRRRVLSPLSLVLPTQHRGNQGPRAPATSTGQSPNG